MSHAYSGDYNSKEMIGQKSIGILAITSFGQTFYAFDYDRVDIKC